MQALRGLDLKPGRRRGPGGGRSSDGGVRSPRLLARAHEYAQPGRLHREAEALAHRRRLGVERDLESTSEHRQRRARLEQCEVAGRAETRAGAEGEEALLLAPT